MTEWLQSRSWLIVVPVLLMAAILGAVRFNSDLFWSDEEYSIYMSGGSIHSGASLFELFGRVADNAWPPLHNILLIPWSWLFGWSEFATRLMALYFGLLAIAMIYRLGRDMATGQAGLIAALMLSSSAFYVHYLHEGRGYTLYVLLALTSVWLYREVTHRSAPGRGLQALFVLSNVLFLHVHYLSLAFLGALGLYHITMQEAGERRTHVFRLFVLSGFLYGPWLSVGVLAALAERNNDRGWDALTVIEKSLDGFANGLWPFLILALLYAAFMLPHRKYALLWFWCLGGMVLALIFNAVSDFIFNIRHILILLPGLLLLAALAIDDLARRFSVYVSLVPVLIWVAAGAYLYAYPEPFNARMGQIQAIPKAPMDAAFSMLDACAGQDEGVMLYMVEPRYERDTWQVLRYYFHGKGWRVGQVDSVVNLPSEDLALLTYAERSDRFLNEASGLWLFVNENLPPVEAVSLFKDEAGRRYESCVQVEGGDDLSVFVYGREDLACLSGWQVQPGCDAP